MRQTITPQIEHPEVIQFGDIVYANRFDDYHQESIPLKLHLLRPNGQGNRWDRLPLFVWVAGGGFRKSTPLYALPFLTWFAQRGFVAASVQHRTCTQQAFPAAVQDVKAAVRFLRSRADVYGIDPERVALGGESAGGYLAALAGLCPDEPAFKTSDWPEAPDDVQAVVSWYAPFTLKGSPLQSDLLGDSAEQLPGIAGLTEIEPHITVDAPPFLLMHGVKDAVVPVTQSRMFYEALVRAGVEAEYYELEGAGHGSIEFVQPQVQQIVLSFLNKHLTIGGS
ncbi:MAG: alpha/beta hydrolase [Clostridiales Family XIII bacterium]|jgi:acetyl esterase/lipase|nr:alpha/beta hydrolase [Clostridiales Family XIII bacterium]